MGIREVSDNVHTAVTERHFLIFPYDFKVSVNNDTNPFPSAFVYAIIILSQYWNKGDTST